MTKKILSLWMILMVLIGLIACDKQPTPEEPTSSPVADLSLVSSEIAEEVDNSVEEVASVIESHPTETNPSKTSSATTPTGKEPEPIATSRPASTEEEPSAPDSSGETVSSDAPVASNARPIGDFEGESVDQLLAWIKAEQASKDPDGAVLDENGNLLRKLLIPKSTRKDLVQGYKDVWVFSDTYGYYFETHVSDKNMENESYRIIVIPLSSTKNWVDSVPVESYLKPYLKSGSYKNLDYVYLDGQKGDDTSPSILPTAWFVHDGNLISIQATWINAYKPWNNEWFEYFDYETITW